MSVLLDKKDYIKTYNLAKECFGDDDFLYDFYNNQIEKMIIAAKFINERIVSMAMCKKMHFIYADHEEDTSYLCCICTSPQYRHKGYMNENIKLLLETITTKTAFLVPVDNEIYSHLGFVYSWNFNESERDMLYADDDLNRCFAKLNTGAEFIIPDGIYE